jgi:hypothetical protein
LRADSKLASAAGTQFCSWPPVPGLLQREGFLNRLLRFSQPLSCRALTRSDIAERINHLYGGKAWKKRGGRGGRVLKVPEPFIPPAGARIMSLQVRA